MEKTQLTEVIQERPTLGDNPKKTKKTKKMELSNQVMNLTIMKTRENQREINWINP